MKTMSGYAHELGNPRPICRVVRSGALESNLMAIGAVEERPRRNAAAERIVRESISHVGGADKRTSVIQAGVFGAGAAGPYPWRCPV